jgi:hypothetical protein
MSPYDNACVCDLEVVSNFPSWPLRCPGGTSLSRCPPGVVISAGTARPSLFGDRYRGAVSIPHPVAARATPPPLPVVPDIAPSRSGRVDAVNAVHHSDFLYFLSFATVLVLLAAVLLCVRAVWLGTKQRSAAAHGAGREGAGAAQGARPRATAAARRPRPAEQGQTGDHSRAWTTSPDQSAPCPRARCARVRMPFDNQLLGRTADAASALVARISALSRSCPRIAAEAW